jgi:hypothetical protein
MGIYRKKVESVPEKCIKRGEKGRRKKKTTPLA